MTAVVRNLFRTTTDDAPATQPGPLDYCECGRGPIIGTFAVRACGTNDRLAFFPLGSIYADLPEVAADLCCLDCVTDAVSSLASGETHQEMAEISRQRRVTAEDCGPAGGQR